MMSDRRFVGRGAGICCVGVVRLRMRRQTLCSKQPALVAGVAARVIIALFNITMIAQYQYKTIMYNRKYSFLNLSLLYC